MMSAQLSEGVMSVNPNGNAIRSFLELSRTRTTLFGQCLAFRKVAKSPPNSWLGNATYVPIRTFARLIAW